MRRFETLQEQQHRFIQVKAKMKKLLDMCLEKEIQININPKCEVVSCYKIDINNEFIFNYDCYYFGDLSELKHDSTMPLDELILKVKSYKK